MSSLTRSVVVGAFTFGASLIGLALAQIVPVDMLNAAKGTIGGVIGLVSLLLALVLGFLVYTAFAVFNNQQTEAFSLGPVIADIDLALSTYGPEAASGRAGLRASLLRTRERFFGDAAHGAKIHTFQDVLSTYAGLDGFFASFQPQTDRQRQLLTKAWDLARKSLDVQMAMTRQLASPFPPRVMTVVIGWASLLFLGDGVISPLNPVAIAALFVGALSVATAMFLVLELSNPYAGIIRIPPDGLDNVLAALGEVQPAANEAGARAA